jgi:hypothetical protein
LLLVPFIAFTIDDKDLVDDDRALEYDLAKGDAFIMVAIVNLLFIDLAAVV